VPECEYDAAVIGGGFFGCSIAAFLASRGLKVTVIEREMDLLTRASFKNQARVHNGYHYPRSILTALRSHVNFGRFIESYSEAICDNFQKLYAIPRQFSKVSASQFARVMERVGSPLAVAGPAEKKLFNSDLIEEVFIVQEYAFDATALRKICRKELEKAGVTIYLGTEVRELRMIPGGSLELKLSSGETNSMLRASRVINCAYSGLNTVLKASGFPVIPLKHEWTELALVEPPEALQGKGITVMCGPFFSCMPFPPAGLHSMSHVRYTPHFEWTESGPSSPSQAQVQAATARKSQAQAMIQDARRFVPALREARYISSLWEVKTVLPKSESDDSRPILFRSDHGAPNLTCVLGAKLDNVFDALEEIKLSFGL
jgi:glycine/D-amino acid oxidase-like deaminating enzyme